MASYPSFKGLGLPFEFPELREALEYHRAHPEKDLLEYREQARKRVTQRALGGQRLYIDTNHWTHLRDAYRGRARDPRYVDLLRELEALVGGAKLVVPLSDQLVEETCHQADPESRSATAEVIDRVSGGVAIVAWRKRKTTEVCEWINSLFDGRDPVPLNSVWSPVYEALGLLDFESTYPDKEFVAAFFKAFDDLAARTGFRGLVGRFEHNANAIASYRDQADRLTGYKSTVWSDQGGFAEVFEQEALSYLDGVLAEPSKELLEDLRRLPLADGLDEADLVVNAKRAFLACERLGLPPTALPGLRVIAGVNSRVRVEKERKFRPGDTADLFHAAAAIPYCDAFLTDRSMRHLLTTQPTDLGTLYKCTVLCTPDEALAYLTRLPG